MKIWLQKKDIFSFKNKYTFLETHVTINLAFILIKHLTVLKVLWVFS